MAPPDYISNTLSNEELKSEFRDFKLRAISGEMKFQFDCKRAANFESQLDFIQSTFPNDTITGSLALNLLGLIHRETSDIDILIDKKERYSGYTLDHYDDEFSTGNRLGYIPFKWKKNMLSKKVEYSVDFFLNDSPSFIEFPFKSGIIRIHNPLEIIDYKLQMATSEKALRATQRKHNEDLTRIFGQAPWQLALRGEVGL